MLSFRVLCRCIEVCVFETSAKRMRAQENGIVRNFSDDHGCEQISLWEHVMHDDSLIS